MYEIPYRVGDWITVEGACGEVTRIGLRMAEIRTPEDTIVVIPNLKLWNTLIFNANDGTQKLQCTAHFFLHPEHDAGLVKSVLHDVALTSSYLKFERPISVLAEEQLWTTHYRLKAYPVEPRDQFRFLTDLTVRGKAALARHGVGFAAGD